MDNQTLLKEITDASRQKIVTKDEVITAYEAGQPAADTSMHKKIGLTDIMYYIGGAIVVLGIGILVFQNWERLNAPVQILVTLGTAIAAYVVGVLFNRYPNLTGPSMAFFLISSLLLPLGLYITLDKAGVDINTAGTAVFVSALMLAVFLASYFIFKKSLFTLFAIVAGTSLFFALVGWIVESNHFLYDSKISEYEFLVTGLVYMLLGYYFSLGVQEKLSGVLYGFGSLSFLGAALALQGFSPSQNAFWELVFPLLVFGIIILSVWLKSKTFLVFGSLFLIGYIFKLAGEYFQENLGWPLALVLAGLIIIGISFYAVRISKKYLSPINS